VSTADYITYTALFVFILATQLGRRTPTLDKLILPVLIVGGIGFKYLSNLPTGTANHLLELAGVAAGLLFGLASVALVNVEKDPHSGRTVTRAGFPYAAVWSVARPTGSTPPSSSSRSPTTSTPPPTAPSSS